MARRKTSPAKSGEPSFEEAISGLEEIVAAMEEEDLPLEELVEKYETGTRLLKRCEEVLRSAKKKIRTIADDRGADAGEDVRNDGQDGEDGENEADDDIRLF